MGCIGKCAINENNHVCCLECQDYKDCPDYVEEEKDE